MWLQRAKRYGWPGWLAVRGDTDDRALFVTLAFLGRE
jgi:hypothetical protein